MCRKELPSVSRHHAAITEKDGSFYIEAVQERNPLFLDGVKLRYGERYLSRQSAALGGGTTEIARNIIGERVLGFPREYAADRDVPFNQVKRTRAEASSPKVR